MDLTPEEAALINERRAMKAREVAHTALRLKALSVAARYAAWLEENHQSSTYGTFINSFGYQDGGGNEMYRIVSDLLTVVDMIQLESRPPY